MDLSAGPVHFPYLAKPDDHPDYERRSIRVPTWDTFGNETHFIALRGFAAKDGRLVDYVEEIERYTKEYGLCDVIWPFFNTIYAANFADLVSEIKQRGLYLFDIWGHVPGSETTQTWGHVMPPDGMVEYLEATLGDHFLGFDNGEQDGRYIGGYARQQCPSPNDRFRQYLNFQRHFQRMCDDLGNNMATLVSLCFGHYFLKEGNHQLIGAETAQALPNSQVYYSFIRGAGKQYGMLWFGNASVFNRWGWKSYSGETSDGHYVAGPKEGTSLALLRRLIYSHILYNSVAVGYESGWFVEEDGKQVLTPIGRLQSGAVKFIEQYGFPGVLHTPVALMLDHFSGWAMPRHLYSDMVYQVWGGMPYDSGDYLTHGLVSLIYPGYVEASYFEDERGFLSPTPYGDCADSILSDAPGWLLSQYGLVILASALEEGGATQETRDKLEAFVSEGGRLVVTAANAALLWPEWSIDGEEVFPAGTEITFSDGTQVTEESDFALSRIAETPEQAEVVARAGDTPVALQIPTGDGAITLLLSPWGLNHTPSVTGSIPNEPHQSLECPFGLLEHVKRIFGDALSRQQIFSAGDDLSLVTCRKDTGEYTVGLFNNDLAEHTFEITAKAGAIESIEELEIDPPETEAVGYWPKDTTPCCAGESTESTIAGGDMRLFHIRLKEEKITLREPADIPAKPSNRILNIGECSEGEIKRVVLRYPTFFQHFDGVKVDWRYFERRGAEQLSYEQDWISRQKLKVVVDFSSGLNMYPDLTLLDTLQFRYDESIEAIDSILKKAAIIGCRDAVVSLHRKPENHVEDDRADERFQHGVRNLCGCGAKHGVTFHIHVHPHKWFPSTKRMKQFAEDIGAENLRLAVDTGHVCMSEEALSDSVATAGDALGAVLLHAPATDVLGQTYDAHLPVHTVDMDLSAVAGAGNDVLTIFNAEYAGWNDIYADIRKLNGTA